MMNSQRVEPCYNTQIAVDSKHKLIIEADVITNPADQGRLSSMGKMVKDILGTDKLEVLADKGYYESKDIKKCVDSGLIPLVPRPKRSRPNKEYLSKDQFTYDKEKDIYICPGGSKLNFQKAPKQKNKIMRFYTTTSCAACPIKNRCTNNKKGRTIMRFRTRRCP